MPGALIARAERRSQPIEPDPDNAGEGNGALLSSTRPCFLRPCGEYGCAHPALDNPDHLERFEQHGRLTSYLQTIPTYVINTPCPALMGATVALGFIILGWGCRVIRQRILAEARNRGYK